MEKNRSDKKAAKKIIAIIPARGGSKTIPRKNVKLLNGKPLISYILETALKSNHINKVVVSTEDEEIAKLAEIYGADVVWRPKNLASDEVTLDPVIFHALNYVEQKEHISYDLVITLQPTSPLITQETIESAINIMYQGNYQTLVAVKEEKHLYWIEKNGNVLPLFKDRQNRQLLEPIYKETGSIVISKREIVSEKERIGKELYLFKIPEEESIDVDTYADWWAAENILKKLKIVFRVDADYEIGLGHVYRTITLAHRLLGHQIIFLANEQKELGLKKVKENNYPLLAFGNMQELFQHLRNLKPDIIVNDILDTSKDYILDLKKLGAFIVNFEDLGEGSEYADLVINALYENSSPPKNHYYGFKYECLRNEFFTMPQKKVDKTVKKILITFGGTDQNNLTLKTLQALEKIDLRNTLIVIVLGIGYKHKRELYKYIDTLSGKDFKIKIKENVKMMASHIFEADIVITSNGRTIYEIASIGTPCISISQNEREVRHLFSHICKGIKNLGLAHNVTQDDISAALKELVNNYELRKDMNKRLLKFNIEGGTDRVLRLIFDKFYEWKEDKSKDDQK